MTTERSHKIYVLKWSGKMDILNQKSKKNKKQKNSKWQLLKCVYYLNGRDTSLTKYHTTLCDTASSRWLCASRLKDCLLFVSRLPWQPDRCLIASILWGQSRGRTSYQVFFFFWVFFILHENYRIVSELGKTKYRICWNVSSAKGAIS